MSRRRASLGRRRAGARTMAVALLCVSVVAGCSDGDTAGDDTGDDREPTTTASNEVAGPRGTPRRTPRVGDCLEPMTTESVSATRLPEIVDCDGPHGGEVVSVYNDIADANAPYPATRGRIQGLDEHVERCYGNSDSLGDLMVYAGDNRLAVPPDLAESTGITRAWAVSGVEGSAFVPSPAAWNDGERWMACAVVLNNSTSAPSVYEGTLEGSRNIRGELRAELAWCKFQPDPNLYREFETVPCTAPHNFEQLASFEVGNDESPFPGEDVLDGLARQLCNDLSSVATAGKSDAVDRSQFDMSWTYPQALEWANGDRIVRCHMASLASNTTGSVGSGSAVAD